tara:strand:+ start:1042 stop:1170 length:129 start_codon:yes stop_codon:yes gene_type:complete
LEKITEIKNLDVISRFFRFKNSTRKLNKFTGGDIKKLKSFHI